MTEGRRINGAALRAAAILLAAIIFSTMPISGIFAATHKGSGGSSSASEDEATSPQVAEFIALLGDPKVRKWLEEQRHAAEASEKPKPHEETVSEYIDSRIGAIREHIGALAAALPGLPNQFEEAVGLIRAEIPPAE
jgi:hypothetical protein